MADVITIGEMMREAMGDYRPGVLLYQCRACGCVVRVQSEQVGRDAAGLVMMGQAIANEVNSEMYQMAKATMPHRCGVDQVGVCDLIGGLAGGGSPVLRLRLRVSVVNALTDSQEHLKIVAPGLLAVIWVHVGGEEAMAAAVAEVLAEDGGSMADIARRHGVRRATLFESVKKLRGLCTQCCGRMGLDPRSMLAVRGEGEEEGPRVQGLGPREEEDDGG